MSWADFDYRREPQRQIAECQLHIVPRWISMEARIKELNQPIYFPAQVL
jgi:hypothetical protein